MSKSPPAPTTLDRIIEAGLWILIFFTPLLINVFNVDAYRTVQATFASIVGVVTIALWIVSLGWTQRWKQVTKLPLLIPMGVFIAWTLLTVGRSPGTGTSFMSWLNLVIYAGLFWVVADLCARQPAVRTRLLIPLFATFALNALVGLMQYARFDFMGVYRGLGINNGAIGNYFAGLDAPAKLGSAAGMLGNQNVLGDFLVGAVPLAAALFLVNLRAWRGAVFAGLTGLGIAALIATLTRGAWVGQTIAFVAMVCVIVLYYRERIAKLPAKAWGGIAVVAALTLSLVVVGGLSGRDGAPSPVARAVEKLKSSGQDSTSQQRINAWRVALVMANDSPVMGQGLGTYKINYFRFLAKSFEGKDIPAVMHHRYVQAHNDFIQAAGELGWPGFLMAIGIPLWFIGVMLRFLWSRTLAAPEAMLLIGSLAGVLGIGVSGIFGFPFHIAASSVLFVTLGGLAASLMVAQRYQEAPEKPALLSDAHVAMHHYVMPVGVGFLAIALVLSIWRPYRADEYAKQGMELYKQGQFDNAQASLVQAISLDGERGDARLLLGIIYAIYQKYPDSAQQLTQAERSYDDVTLHYYLGRVYEAMGKLPDARDRYLRAVSYFPPGTDIREAVDERLELIDKQLKK